MEQLTLNSTAYNKQKMKAFDVKTVPTTIIDDKVVDIPDFPWICGKDLYSRLKKGYLVRR